MNDKDQERPSEPAADTWRPPSKVRRRKREESFTALARSRLYDSPCLLFLVILGMWAVFAALYVFLPNGYVFGLLLLLCVGVGICGLVWFVSNAIKEEKVCWNWWGAFWV